MNHPKEYLASASAEAEKLILERLRNESPKEVYESLLLTGVRALRRTHREAGCSPHSDPYSKHRKIRDALHPQMADRLSHEQRRPPHDSRAHYFEAVRMLETLLFALDSSPELAPRLGAMLHDTVVSLVSEVVLAIDAQADIDDAYTAAVRRMVHGG